MSGVLTAVGLQTRRSGMLFCVVIDFVGDHIAYKCRVNQSKKMGSLDWWTEDEDLLAGTAYHPRRSEQHCSFSYYSLRALWMIIIYSTNKCTYYTNTYCNLSGFYIFRLVAILWKAEYRNSRGILLFITLEKQCINYHLSSSIYCKF